jgi:hypothetical protein
VPPPAPPRSSALQTHEAKATKVSELDEPVQRRRQELAALESKGQARHTQLATGNSISLR